MCQICATLAPERSDCAYASASSSLTATQPNAAGETWSVDQIATQLTTGFWTYSGQRWTETGDGTISFARSAGGVVTYSTAGLGAREAQMVAWAFEIWRDATGLKFTKVASDGDIALSNSASGAFGGPLWTIGNTIVSSTVNVGTDWLRAYGTTLDSYTMVTYVHEIGHALGLGHAGNYNGSAQYATDRLYDNDTWSMSVMSYFDQSEIGLPAAFPLTPMIADIVATGRLYGGATQTRHGDTVYGIGGNTTGYLDLILGQMTGDDARNTANWKGDAPVAFVIVDTGGHNRINFSTDTTAQTVSLGGGRMSSVYGGRSNMGIANGTIIHDYVGGKASDRITGNEANNRLWGGAGNDLLFGARGADTLYGGMGNDRMDGGDGNDVIYADGGNDTIIGGAGVDRLALLGTANQTLDLRVTTAQATGAATLTVTGIEHVTSGSGHDVIHGTTDANNLTGGAGNDRLYGYQGNDTLFGGAGNDRLDGGDGDDLIYANGGNDTIIGGAGSDRIVLVGTANQALDLRVTAAQATGAATLIVSGVEHANGGQGADRLIGTSQGNLLVGGAGNDRLLGIGGNDTLMGGDGLDVLFGGTGRDVMTGGAGADSFVFVTRGDTGLGGAADVITDFRHGTDLINLTALDLSSFRGSAAFSGTAGEVRAVFANGNTRLDLDYNGDRITDASIVLTGVTTFDASDLRI